MLKKDSFLSRLRRFDLTGEFFITLGTALGLTALTYLFSSISLTTDKMEPFHSTGFVLSVGAVFYMAFAHGTRQALYLAAGVLTLILMVWLERRNDPNDMSYLSPLAIAVQVPLVTLFLVALTVLPNVLPWQYESEAEELAAKNRELDKTLQRLREQFQRIQQQEIIERTAQAKQEQIKVGSRIAFLNSFARELLQASSNRELLNLLFHNMTRLLQLEECLLLLPNEDGKEVSIVRALHPQHDQLENTRMPTETELIAQVLSTKKPVSCLPPQRLNEHALSRLLLPVISHENDQVVAIYSLGTPKGGDLGADDEEFVAVLTAMLAGAMEQLRISSATA